MISGTLPRPTPSVRQPRNEIVKVILGTQEIFSGDVYARKWSFEAVHHDCGVSRTWAALHQHAREGANKSLIWEMFVIWSHGTGFIMSHQLTFADSEFSKRRQTRKEIFLSCMEQILPWQKHGGSHRAVLPPRLVMAGDLIRWETMLRIHCMQHWYNLSDGAMEDALYEIASMRLLPRLSLDSALPGPHHHLRISATCWSSINWPANCSKTINRWLAEAGVMMTQGTFGDATIIEAPSSTKNKEQQRDPRCIRPKRQSVALALKAPLVSMPRVAWPCQPSHHRGQRAWPQSVGHLLHGEEQFVSSRCPATRAPQRAELAEVDVDLIAERPGKVRNLETASTQRTKRPSTSNTWASIRAKVEHPFCIIKRQFGFVKAWYKGLLKNDKPTGDVIHADLNKIYNSTNQKVIIIGYGIAWI